MKEQDDALRRFYDSFRKMKGRLHILEHRVPVEEQMRYFRYSNRIRKEKHEVKDDDCELYETGLYSEELPNDEKKKILSILASSKQVWAYRLLESYVQQPSEELVGWAYMALMESRISIESELSDERQIYVSTGLGGRGEKLRFYILVISSGGASFLDYQRGVVRSELEYVFSKNDCDIERLTVEDRYVELVALIPVSVDIRGALENAISECNLYGRFLSEVFTITNVKEFSREDVAKILERYGNDEAGH